ncbi:hypothetical protein KC331_g13809 [Hortaea werneckii]|nr:hypothetical protein KC331_g13809 [Hortaea werneckii]KAI7704394.1 hypothetical protein KC353_g13510 [Hortaea werneckii]
MEGSAASIVRGEFVYRDTLFVDVGGDGKRHPRASPAELKDLLNGKVAKDQVGHWYEAQLIHYGLQRSKQKDTAKVRLQQALSQSKLKVPPHIADMEGQMKKEYAAAVRKAKKSVSGEDAPVKMAKRRKDEEEIETSSKKTKIAMNVGDISINIEHGAAVSEASKSSSKSSTKVTAGTANAKQTADPKGKSLSKTTPAKASAKQTAKTSKPAASSESAAPDATPTTVKEPKIKSEPKIKKDPGTKKPAVIKTEPQNDEMQIDSFAQEMPGTRNVTGVYNISCPQLAEQIGPDEASNFRLFLCVDNGTLWGGFELGWKSGVMRADEVAVDRYVSFGWRARDNDRGGSLTFGRGCFGEIVLHGQNEVRDLQVLTHQIPSYNLTPNTALQKKPLLIYRSAFPPSLTNASLIEDHFTSIGVVAPQWRYTMYSTSHFHSTSHEVLGIASGRARLCFGHEENEGRVVEELRKGDVVVVPAGVAHRLMEDVEGGFSMVGSYPKGCNWDMCYGHAGEEAKIEKIKDLPWFTRDPVYGDSGPVLDV